MGKMTQEDKILITNLQIEKLCRTRKRLNKFPRKQWTRSGGHVEHLSK